MEYLLIFAASFFIGYFIGRIRTIIKIAVELNRADHTNVKESDLIKQEIPILIAEEHDNMLYLFNKETDKFMCQGRTLNDLLQKLSDYQGIYIAHVLHGHKSVFFVNGEIRETL